MGWRPFRSRQGLVATFLFALVAACGRPPAEIGPEAPFPGEPGSTLLWPVRGTIVTPYRPPSRPGHQGVDMAGAPGDRAVAALPGKVSFAGTIPGYGNVVAISHEDHLTTLYAHLGDVSVRQNESVGRGQAIGHLAADGLLHYEIRRGKEAVDPQEYYAVLPQPPRTVAPPSAPASEPSEAPLEGKSGVAEPTPSATAAATATPIATPTAPRSEPPAASTPGGAAPEQGTLGGPSAPAGGMGVATAAALVGANLLYVPAKGIYAAVGGLTGCMVLALSHDPSVAHDVWSRTLGGDYVVRPEHLRGEAPLHFAGSEPAKTP